ncbi:sperm flagellar protein 1-like [Drosophila miranda]|uniref:sperm flagellar protein 1-like n=1 Tax=Drosophila miranda TaxID=7229 RepID=UPI0007E737D7|nr:sperm flagellar protein 1-like [Drosophila miranda]
MSGFRVLDEEDRLALISWLKEHNIELNHRTRTELRDAFAVAKICKRIHPDLVDLQVYTPRCSMTQMLNNWKIFNDRVLKKLDLNLSHLMLKELAGGAACAIESILHKLMTTEYALKRGEGKPNLAKKPLDRHRPRVIH